MHPDIESRKKEIAELCRKYQIRQLEVFGSAAREHDFDPESSDFDFIVDYIPVDGGSTLRRVMGFRRELASVMGCKVDVMDKGARCDPYFMVLVNRDRKTIYAC
ncbi:MAG: nucleotidyltransferase domain-containing protein [Rhodobacteraceae bacterium]|nr:nucleotidyltransferase domain-containing protein [Paracoccaceae bacterium]MCY4196358.1 nucleotidyltransferase domain-containing protein [Paracoccaceae bacterium]